MIKVKRVNNGTIYTTFIKIWDYKLHLKSFHKDFPMYLSLMPHIINDRASRYDSIQTNWSTHAIKLGHFKNTD